MLYSFDPCHIVIDCTCDIMLVLNVDLEVEFAVLDMIKNNTKIDMEESTDRVLSFQYRAKYEIR